MQKPSFLVAGFVLLVFVSIIALLTSASGEIEWALLFHKQSVELLVYLALTVAVHFFLEPCRWRLYIHSFNNQNVTSFPRIVSVYTVTALLSYSMPFKLGIPARVLLMTQYLKLTTKSSVYFLTLDGLINLCMWMTLGIVALYFVFPFELIKAEFLYYLLVIPLILAVVYLLRKIIQRVYLLIKEKVGSISVAIVTVCSGIVLIDIVSFGLRHLIIFSMLDISLPAFDVFWIGVCCIFIGIISTLPMGLGAYDGALILILRYYGVEVEVAVVAAMLNRAMNLMVAIIAGAGGSLFLMKHQIENSSSD